LAAFPELEQFASDVAVQEEVLVLLAAVPIHAASRVATALIPQVQIVVPGVERKIATRYL
jgi:hypothetical protein